MEGSLRPATVRAGRTCSIDCAAGEDRLGGARSFCCGDVSRRRAARRRVCRLRGTGSGRIRDVTHLNYPHWGILRAGPEISAARPGRSGETLEKVRISSRSLLGVAGAALAPGADEHHVFRAALLSVVMSLALGQNAGLFCKVWCHDATLAQCPHEETTTSSSVSADDRCEDTAIDVVAFVREDARRAADAPDARNAPGVARFRVAPSPDLLSDFESGRRLLEARPLVISLRI